MENKENYQPGDFAPGRGHFFICDVCNTPFFGRSDKKHCSTYCKNKINNARAKKRKAEISQDELAMRLNHSILKDLYSYSLEKTALPVAMLINKGFDSKAPNKVIVETEAQTTIHFYLSYGYSYDEQAQTFKIYKQDELR